MSRSIARSTSSSVPGSRLDVASSSTSSAGSTSAARASDTSCFSPADSREPRSRTSVLEALRAATRTARARRRGERLVDLVVGRVAPGDADVVADRAVEQEALLRAPRRCVRATTAGWRRAGRCRRSGPDPRSGRRAGRSAWPASTCRRRSVRPGPASPGRDGEGRRRAAPGRAGVGEGDVLDDDLAGVGQVDRAHALGHVDRRCRAARTAS